MAEYLPRVLDDRPLQGSISVRRDLLPTLETLVVANFADAMDAVSYACQIWGGAAERLVPHGRISSDSASPWNRLLESLDFDHFRGFGVEDSALPERPDAWAGRPSPLIVTLSALVDDRENKPSISIPSLDDGDPWLLAYLAIFGNLPDRPSPSLVEQHYLRDDLAYADVLSIDRPAVVGGVEDLWSRIWDRTTAYPTSMTLAGLSVDSAPSRRYAQPPLLPKDAAPGMRFGSSTVVVYEPGSVEDLCLLWCLRSASGWPYGAPLAVPRTADVPQVIRQFERLGARSGSPSLSTGGNRAVVSASVGADDLDAIAQELGDEWTVAELDQVLNASPRPRRTSIEIAAFENGRAPVFAWGTRDVADLGDYHKGRSLETLARFRPVSMQLPSAKSFLGDRMMNGTWRGGSFEISDTDLDRVHTMQWPVGWTVLEAVMRDRGYAVRRSRPGRAAEALVQRVGSLDEVPLLGDAKLIKALYRLGERSGSTYFKGRLNDILRELHTVDGADERIRVLEAKVDAIIAGEDADFRTVTADSLSFLGATDEIRDWLEWAEQSGVLLRGTEVTCSRCGHKHWATLAELSPPILCRGCGLEVARPYRADTLQFRYRATETLLRALEHDCLGHLLTLAWMAELFHRGFDKTETLYGGYPGVEVVEQGGRVVGEVDVLLLFSDGSLALGEYKRGGAGLTQSEIEKLDRLADALGADWTFVATHDESADCPEIWQECQAALPDRPRFALTADHLFSTAIWAMGSNPFAWPDSASDEAPRRRSVVDFARFLSDSRAPDSSLHRHWEWLDSKDPA